MEIKELKKRFPTSSSHVFWGSCNGFWFSSLALTFDQRTHKENRVDHKWCAEKLPTQPRSLFRGEIFVFYRGHPFMTKLGRKLDLMSLEILRLFYVGKQKIFSNFSWAHSSCSTRCVAWWWRRRITTQHKQMEYFYRLKRATQEAENFFIQSTSRDIRKGEVWHIDHHPSSKRTARSGSNLWTIDSRNSCQVDGSSSKYMIRL